MGQDVDLASCLVKRHRFLQISSTSAIGVGFVELHEFEARRRVRRSIMEVEAEAWQSSGWVCRTDRRECGWSEEIEVLDRDTLSRRRLHSKQSHPTVVLASHLRGSERPWFRRIGQQIFECLFCLYHFQTLKNKNPKIMPSNQTNNKQTKSNKPKNKHGGTPS